jgi:hypothetical protein
METLCEKIGYVLGKLQDAFSIALALLVGPVFFCDVQDE